MAAMSTYTVRAKRWAHGWELHIDGVGVTQSRNLDGAEQMVRDYIESLTDRDTSGDGVAIKPEAGGGLAVMRTDAIQPVRLVLAVVACRELAVADLVRYGAGALAADLAGPQVLHTAWPQSPLPRPWYHSWRPPHPGQVLTVSIRMSQHAAMTGSFRS
jgi:hypothetical protein